MQVLKRSLLLFSAAAFALTACKDDDPVQPAAKVNSVTVSPDGVPVRVGQQLQMVATVDVEGGASDAVTWSTSRSQRATVSTAGLVTAGTETGPVVITATSTADPSKSGVATLTIVAGQVFSVGVAPGERTLFGGEAATFASVVNAEAGVSQDVTWSLTPATGVATISASTGSSATVTALANPGPSIRTVVLRATSQADPSKTGVATITVPPGSAPSGVLEVNVSPATAAMRFGDPDQVFTAQVVTSNPGVSTAVNWSVSDPSKVTIVSSTASSVTVRPANATVTGQVAIQAVSAVDAGRSGAAVLTILPPLTPATVSIAQINAGGTGLPVNPLAVAGQIDVVANIDPGDFIITKIELMIDGRVVGQQDLAVSADAPAADVSQVTLVYNTARYGIPGDPDPTLTTSCLAGNPAPPAGHACVDFLNGEHVVQLRITTSNGTTTATAASIETNLTFANVSGFHNHTTPPTNSTTGSNGQIWYGGPAGATTRVRSWPVRYDNRVITSATLCSSNVTGAAPIPAGVPGPGTTCSTDASAPFDVNLTIPQSNAPGTPAAFGFVNAAVAADLLPVPTVAVNLALGQALLNAQTAINVDNTAPTGFALAYNTVAPAGNRWVNATYNFLSGVTVGADAGVGLNSGTAAGLVAAGALSLQWSPVCTFGGFTAGTFVAFVTNTGADIPESTCDFTNAAFNVRMQARDRLGNQTGNINLAGGVGVDKTAPMIRARVAPALPHANLAVFSGAFGAAPQLQVEYQDDRAGFAALPQRHSLVNANHATAAVIPLTNLPSDGQCIIGTGNPGITFLTAPACNPVLVASAGTFAGDGFLQGAAVDLSAFAAPNDLGYYRYDTFVHDQAGNASATFTRQLARDPDAPEISTGNGPLFITAATGATYTSISSDDVEVISGTFRLTYPNVPGALQLGYPRTAAFATFDNVISSPAQMTHSVPFGAPFVRSIITTAADSTPGATNGLEKPTVAGLVVWDVFGTPSAQVNFGIAGAIVEDGVSFAAFNAANPTRTVEAFYVRDETGAIGFIPAGIKAQVRSSFSSTNAPFVRVDFYRLSGGEYQYVGSASGTSAGVGGVTNTDDGVNRFWTYVISTTSTVNSPITLTQIGGLTPATIIAVGVTAAGDGLLAVNDP